MCVSECVSVCLSEFVCVCFQKRKDREERKNITRTKEEREKKDTEEINNRDRRE